MLKKYVNFLQVYLLKNGPYYRAGASVSHVKHRLHSKYRFFIHLLPRHHPTLTAPSSEHDLTICNIPPPPPIHPIILSAPLSRFFRFFFNCGVIASDFVNLL